MGINVATLKLKLTLDGNEVDIDKFKQMIQTRNLKSNLETQGMRKLKESVIEASTFNTVTQEEAKVHLESHLEELVTGKYAGGMLTNVEIAKTMREDVKWEANMRFLMDYSFNNLRLKDIQISRDHYAVFDAPGREAQSFEIYWGRYEPHTVSFLLCRLGGFRIPVPEHKQFVRPNNEFPQGTIKTIGRSHYVEGRDILYSGIFRWVPKFIRLWRKLVTDELL